MEFSRVSPKRRMGLVVCLDPAGVPCPTHAVASTRASLAEARSATSPGASGRRSTGSAASASPPAPRRGATRSPRWCATGAAAAGWTGAVWTDLLPNYAEMLGEAFSIERGVAYLRTLAGESLDEAVRYIENAPATTDTPLRRRLRGRSVVAGAGGPAGGGARLTGVQA